jgi:hypothetical protein
LSAKFDYKQAQSDADGIIDFFGMIAALRRLGIPDRPCKVVIVEYNPRDKDTQLSNPVDRHVIISALDPTTGQQLALPPDNEQDVLVTFVQPAGLVVDKILMFTSPVKPTAPAGVPAIYECTVRR